MKNIRIEKVGDINTDYPYLEVFFQGNSSSFLEIGISHDKQLVFEFDSSNTDIQLNVEDWEYILLVAKQFLPKVLKDEDDFQRHFGET